MKHIFKYNIYRKGYTLISRSDKNQMQEHPLELESDIVSRNFLAAEKKIEQFLSNSANKWTICISYSRPTSPIIMAYGRLLPAPDEMKRGGLGFIHAFEIEDASSLDNFVKFVTVMLSQQFLNSISDSITKTAVDSSNPYNLIDYIVKEFEAHEQSNDSSFPVIRDNIPLKEIKHDCSGTPFVAWLIMAVSHLNCSPPWEIYDSHSYKDGVVSTVSSYAGAYKQITLSDYLVQAIHVNELLGQVYKPQSVTTLYERTPTSFTSSSKKALQQANTGQSAMSTEHTYQHLADNEEVLMPVGGIIVELSKVYLDAIDLADGVNIYIVDERSCKKFSEESTYFDITVMYRFFLKKLVRLVLPKSKISSDDIKKISYFMSQINPSW